jgi:hypothetical protein
LTKDAQAAIRDAVVQSEMERTRQRELALRRRALTSCATSEPYRAKEGALTWRDDLEFSDDADHNEPRLEVLQAALAAAEADGTLKRYSNAGSFLEESDVWLVPEKLDCLRGYANYTVAVVRPRPFGFKQAHTYAFAQDDELFLVTTCTPAAYARFRACWERGMDHMRAQARQRGMAV